MPQKRQAQHGEIIAIHPFEKLNAETFELIGADARGRASPLASRYGRGTIENPRIVSRAALTCSNSTVASCTNTTAE